MGAVACMHILTVGNEVIVFTDYATKENSFGLGHMGDDIFVKINAYKLPPYAIGEIR